MNVFKRILKIGQAEIHAFVDRMENPVVMMEQGVKNLKEELAESVEAFAKLKALLIRMENTIAENKQEATRYEEKAVLVLRKVDLGSLAEEKAEQLAVEALKLKQGIEQEIVSLEEQLADHKVAVEHMATNVEVLKFNIAKWEKELGTLKAKQCVSETSEAVNRHIANIDSNSTIDLLQRMKDKVTENGARAEVFDELSFSKTKVDKSLEDLVNEDAVSEKLNQLKNKIGLK